MIDWCASMQQTFEYYIVDPGTWRDISRIDKVKSSTIIRNDDTDTFGSASINITETLGECYMRIYLIAIQNGVREKIPLGTYLIQTPSLSFNGKIQLVTLDAYTPLLELKETMPPIGFSLLKSDNIMTNAYRLCREHVRAPVIKPSDSTRLFNDFVSDVSDTWLTFLRDLISNAKYDFMLDELGRILFAPRQDTASLQPVWTYDDGNSSILYPDIDVNYDLYGVPNVVEVIYSNSGNNYYAKVVNNNPNSPISTVNRGREIVYRVTDPDLIGNPTDFQINRYASQVLSELSSIESTVTYTHGYCPVRVGDCVRLNYKRAGLTDIKAKVKSQTIKCLPGCQVTEKAVFTTNLWR